MSTKERRLAYPSGWLYLCQHSSVHLMIDALVQADPKKEFTQTELAETAGGRRYHYDLDSSVGQFIAELNGELAALGAEPSED